MQRFAWVAVGLVLVTGFVNWSSGQEAAVLVPPEAPFQGKVLSISFRTDAEHSCLLEEVSIQRLGNEMFLVGTGVDSGHPTEWTEGLRQWVAVGDVSQIIEFESAAAYRKAAVKAYEGLAPGANPFAR